MFFVIYVIIQEYIHMYIQKKLFFFLYQFLMINSHILRVTVQCNKSLFIYTKKYIFESIFSNNQFYSRIELFLIDFLKFCLENRTVVFDNYFHATGHCKKSQYYFQDEPSDILVHFRLVTSFLRKFAPIEVRVHESINPPLPCKRINPERR